MHRENATWWEFVEPPAFDAPPPFVDDGPAAHAATSKVRAAVTMMAAAARALIGHGRERRRIARVQSFIVSPQVWMIGGPARQGDW
jgi:hypothetical protein